MVLIEFLLPQSPKSMRGTVVGLWFSLRISRGYFDLIVYLPFHYMSSDFPMGRGLYFFLTRSILCLVILLFFVFLAKRYKFRIREVEINIYQVAEDHITRNI